VEAASGRSLLDAVAELRGVQHGYMPLYKAS
jgi:hypothetical protein